MHGQRAHGGRWSRGGVPSVSGHFNFGHGDRPKVRPPRRTGDLVLNVLALISVLAGVVVVAWAWPGLPDTIPIHFNAAGEADGWGGKATLWLLPAISGVMVPAMLALQRVPWIANTPIAIDETNAMVQYALIVRLLAVLACIVGVVFLLIVIETVVTAHGGRGPLGAWMLPALIAPMLVTLVWYIAAAVKAVPAPGSRGDEDQSDQLSSGA